ncbi:MAG: enoyl-CoA hydratase-related protein, partial [Alphaproteobacteria bacterium]
MDSTQDIVVSGARPGVLLITLDRPQVRNALRTAMLAEIAHALDDAARDDGVRCVVLTGGAKVFAAGADIKEMAELDRVSAARNPRFEHWDSIRRFPKPLIAAVNGYALGGGNELAMHADIVIAGADARFGQPEVNLGAVPGAGGTQRLTRIVGKPLAMKMILAGELIDAEAALRAGLVTEVAEPERVLDRALDLAESIAAKPPLAVRAAKEAVLAAYEMTLEAGLRFERRAYLDMFATEDLAEGVRAFAEKRKP